MADNDLMLRVLQRFAETLVSDYTISDAIGRLAADAGEAMDLSGAGVMIEDEEGELRFVSTTDEHLRRLEELQIEFGEGPCLQAYLTGEEVRAPDLTRDDRFPKFAPAAIEVGLCAVHSFPLTVEGRTIGALNAYASDASELDQEQVEIGRTLARVAAAYLLHATDLRESAKLTGQLQHALETRVKVEQAKGYLAARADVSVDEALEALRAHARRNQQRLQDAAAAVLAGDLGWEDLTGG